MSLLTWNLRPRGTLLALLILGWMAFVHLAGTYLFTQGFLLTRMALSDVSSCSDGACELPATHQRLVLLIIDALRFDFVSPDPPLPSSPFHHNVLTLPRELTAKYPSNSLLFNSFSDPPTTTLQRIKGITTGSLPTFVDIGSSFGGSSIDEDSLISQLHRAGKRTAFMGDDTWMTVFPTLFAPNMTFPYDSFNVEDLHTVDEGVIRHLFPLLTDKSRSWDAIIGHFLGVDHVAHRVGPDHPTMKAKLLQMDNVLRDVVEHLDDDTLLVVLGDHGMDRKGDHGGDDVFETSAALWLYSKGVALQEHNVVQGLPSELLLKTTYPKAPTAHRWIQQIDIVPTLSLLLGLPIPFNNLGSIIPEAFARPLANGASVLNDALRLNAQQIQRYLSAYHLGSQGGELDEQWPVLESTWQSVLSSGETDAAISTYAAYTRTTLEVCRSLWARFNVAQMVIGLFVLGLSVVSGTVLYVRLSAVTDWENWANKRVDKMAKSLLLGVASSPIVYIAIGRYLRGMGILDVVLMNASIASCVTLLWDGLPSTHLPKLSSIPVVLIIHALCFLSNSFTFWEDRILTFFLVSSLIPSLLTALTSPDARLRYRILIFSALYAICVRLMAFSTVCREEQQPYCLVTFYASAQVSSSPLFAVLASLPVSILLPTLIRRFLAISASDKGVVPKFLKYVLRPALVAGSICWILEWAETVDMIGVDATLLRIARTVVARLTFYGVLLGGVSYWCLDPLCIEIRVSKPKTPGSKPNAAVLVNSNAYGASYLLFWSLIFALEYLTAQLPGQIALSLTLIALLAHFELIDSVRDVQGINDAFANAKLSAALDLNKTQTAPFTFAQLVPLAQLGLHAFFATGHQATLSSLQWKTAFLLTPVLSFYASRITFALNTFGPILICASAAPLLACWQLPATTGAGASRSTALGASVRACLGVMQCFAVLLLSSAASAAVLRRHLMVWKVFAPRFMAAAVGLACVDVAMVLVLGLGVHRASWRLARLIEGMEQGKKRS